MATQIEALVKVLATANLVEDTQPQGLMLPLVADSLGVLLNRITGVDATGGGGDYRNVSVERLSTASFVPSTNHFGLDVVALNYGFNGTSMVRITAGPPTTDTDETDNRLNTNAVLKILNEAGNALLSLRGDANNNLNVSENEQLDINRVISAASTNATVIKASAGTVHGWYISNVNAAARFVKFYNKATAPTVGTDTPLITLAIPGNAAGAGTNVSFNKGLEFDTGIGIAITGAVPDADTTVVAANEIVTNIFFK